MEMEEDKSRHPAKEQPGYKSLHCEQNGESPSAGELLLFHCTFTGLQETNTQDNRGVFEESAWQGFQEVKLELQKPRHLGLPAFEIFWDFHHKC